MLRAQTMHSDTDDDRWTAPVLALLAALLAWQLLIPPVVGLADTGDFERLWRWFGITAPTDDPAQRYFRYLIREWRIDPSAGLSSGFVSTDLIFVAASVALNGLVSEPGVYDIRTLAAVRSVVLLLGAFLLMRVARHGGVAMQAIAAVALLFVVGDVAYIAYFNSGFTEPGSLLFGLIAIALYVRLVVDDGAKGPTAVAFVASCVLLLWSKPQNVVLAIPLAWLAWRAIAGTNRRHAHLVAGACALIVIVAAALYRSWPPPLWYTQQIRHIAVFNSLLLESPDPAADLRELGVDPRWVVLKGRFPWNELSTRNAQALQTEFHDRVDNGTIARFYSRHPERVIALLKRSAYEANAVRGGSGQFEASSRRPPFSKPRWFGLRSDFVQHFVPVRFRWLVVILGVAVGIATYAWLRARTRAARLLAEGVIIAAVTAVIQYVVVALLQGPVAVSKGMLLYAFLFDVMVVGAIAIVVQHLRTVLRLRGRTVTT